MSTDRLRVLLLALASLAMMVGALVIVDWFVLEIPGLASMGVGEISVDLRSVHACNGAGVCGSAPIAGLYHMFAVGAFWGGWLLCALVVLQAGSRLVLEQTNPSLNWAAYSIGILVIVCSFMAAYVAKPDPSGAAAALGQLTVTRTFAPLAMLIGAFLGMMSVHYATTDSMSTTMDTPRLGTPPEQLPGPLPTARARRSTIDPSPAGADTAGPAGLAASAPAPAPAEPIDPARHRISGSISPVPDQLKGKLAFATLTAELGPAGIDARREDGKTVLVMWRDVVGVVARKLPPEHDGASFVDVVSTAGSTLRLLPWTRISGETIAGTTDTTRALSFLDLAIERCPNITLDGATRKFVEQRGEPAQLPSADMLAAHDSRLA